MRNKKVSVLCLFLALCVLLGSLSVSAADAIESSPFEGKGKADDPYLIQSVEDLVRLRELVHEGNSFQDRYFLQTVDLDLATTEETKIWFPIGTWWDGEDRFFFGIYNGGGHVIKNLNTENSISGLFSFLGGTVMNLGIESGHIQGDYVGAITSHATGGFARIINCYSLADVTGIRAGGLADNFYGGTIINSWSAGEINGSETEGGIVAFGVSFLFDSFSIGELPPHNEGSAGLSSGAYSIPRDEANIPALIQAMKDRAHPDRTWMAQALYTMDGTGTEKDPYQVDEVNDLRLIEFFINAGNGVNFYGTYFVQTADIDLADHGTWRPIGSASLPFCGYYDGAGHAISNLNIQGGDGEDVALFGALNGTVMNLGIESGRIEGDRAAAIVGCTTANASIIINCYNKAEVIGRTSAAGIVNSFPGGLVINCLNTGVISAPRAAGICVDKLSRMQACFSVGSPVALEDTEGIIRLSCRQLSSAEEAAPLLNDALYESATLSNYQRNHLLKWNGNGGFSGERHNYFAQFLIREIAVALLAFAIAFLTFLIIQGGKRRRSLSLLGAKQTFLDIRQDYLSDRARRVRTILSLGFVFCYGMFLVGLINGDTLITKAFAIPEMGDGMMDFYNPMKSTLKGNYFEAGHYTAGTSTYPPVARAILWMLGKCLPTEAQFASGKGIREHAAGLMLVIFVFLIACLILFKVYSKLTPKGFGMITIGALFCSHMFFLYSRGNTLIFVLVFSALFLAGYKSENPVLRHLSYACLGLAAAIKIYPVVLGLLVVREKRVKHILQCIAYGVAFCVVPFLIIGVDELMLYVRNVTTYLGDSAMHNREGLLSYGAILATLADRLLGNAEIGTAIAKYTLLPLVALLGVCACISKKEWKAVMAVMLIQVLYPGASVSYCGVLYALPMLVFAKEAGEQRREYLYAGLFIAMLAPFQFVAGAWGGSRLGVCVFVATNSVIFAMALIVDCLTDGARDLCRWVNGKRLSQQATAEDLSLATEKE